jgi:hypothetical protein
MDAYDSAWRRAANFKLIDLIVRLHNRNRQLFRAQQSAANIVKIPEPRVNAKELGRQNPGGLSLEPYFEQTCAMEWHHCPFSQIARAAPAPVPQRHLAVACWPSAQAAIIGLCAWVA